MFAITMTWGILLGLNSVVMPQRREVSAESSAARIALLALRTAAGVSASQFAEWTVSIGGSRATDEHVAADLLLSLAKPVTCIARKEERSLIIDCKTPELNGELLGHLLARRETAANSWRETLRRKFGASGEDETVLVRAGDETLIAPASATRVFLRDYWLPGTLSLLPPDREALDRGAAAVVRIQPDGQVEVTFPPM